MKKILLSLTLLSLLASGRFVNAGTHVWSGAQDGYWSNPANWSSGGVPHSVEPPPIILQFPSDAAARRNTTNDLFNIRINGLAIFGSNYKFYNSYPFPDMILVGGPPPFPLANNLLCGGTNTVIAMSVIMWDNITIGVATDDDLTITGAMTGTGGFTKHNVGTLTLGGNAANYYNGPTTVAAGTLILNKSSAEPAVPGPLSIGNNLANGTPAEVKMLRHSQISSAAPITINDSGTLNLSGNLQTIGRLTLMGGDIKTGAGMLTLSADVLATNGLGSVISGYVHLGATKPSFRLAPGYGVNFTAQVSDIGSSVGFDMDGGGLLTLSAANTALFGPINVKGGVLYARNNDALGKTTGGTTISSGARLAIDGRNLGAEPITLAGDGDGGYGALSCARTNTLTGPITLAADCAINVVSTTDRLILGGPISGVGGVDKVGYGTLEFTGYTANNYAGTTTLAEGSLELTKIGYVSIPAALVIGDDVSPYDAHVVRILGASQFAATSPVTIHASGVLDLSAAFFAPQTIGALRGYGPLKLGVSSLTVANATDEFFQGHITGTGSLIKQGSGKLTLGGASDQFFGSSIVNAGTLFIQNWNPSSPVTVNAGAKLTGSGRVGNVTSVGGTVDAGCCVGSMRLDSKNLSLDSASVFPAQLNGTNKNGWVNSSQLNVTGTVNLASATLKATLGFNSATNDQFPILLNDGNEAINGTFKGLLEGAKFAVGPALMQITYQGGTGNDVVLTHIGTAAAQIGTVESLPNGQKKITGTGFPGLTYTVEASTDLKTWLAIGTATAASPGGQLSFIDPDAPNFPHRFYRFLAP